MNSRAVNYKYQITIGVPVFNVEPYVEKAILSALEQDFDLPYEVLIVDDCGSDRSLDIIHDIAKTHRHGNRIRIIANESNQGIGEVRNTIIHNSEGRFLFFLDPDDWMEERALSVLYNKAIETDADLTAGSSWYFNDDGIKAEYKEYPDIFINHDSAGVYLLDRENISIRGELWAKLWSIDFIKSHNIECRLRIVEDFIPDFISLVESSRICLVSDFVYNYYFMRSGSIMSATQTQRIKERCIAWVKNITAIKELVSNKYRNVDGIYDLYLTKCRHCYRNALSSPLDSGLIAEMNPFVKGSMSIIPSFKHIHKLNNKLMWLCLRKNDSLECYSKYERGLSIVSHIIYKLKRVFHS